MPIPLHIVNGYSPIMMTELNWGCMACKTSGIYYLPLYRKSISNPALGEPDHLTKQEVWRERKLPNWCRKGSTMPWRIRFFWSLDSLVLSVCVLSWGWVLLRLQAGWDGMLLYRVRETIKAHHWPWNHVSPLVWLDLLRWDIHLDWLGSQTEMDREQGGVAGGRWEHLWTPSSEEQSSARGVGTPQENWDSLRSKNGC